MGNTLALLMLLLIQDKTQINTQSSVVLCSTHYIFIFNQCFLQVCCQITSCLACRNKHSNSFHVLFFIQHCAKVLNHLYFLFILLPRSQTMLSGLSESLEIGCFLHSLLVQSFLCPFSEECFLSLFWFNVLALIYESVKHIKGTKLTARTIVVSTCDKQLRINL